MYLGASLAKMSLADGTWCWTMSPDKYVKSAISNVEETLAKEGRRLPGKCVAPFSCNSFPWLETSTELNAAGIQRYQELIGVLRWAVEIGRVDILLETSLLSTYLAMPRAGHLEQAYHIFGYLKHQSKRKLGFDAGQPNIDERRFRQQDWTELRSQSGILLFCNKAPIIWYSKRQNSVEASTFGSEFTAMKTAIELIESLRYKLRMFGVPIEGPTSVFCDNEAVCKNTTLPESVLNKKHHSIAYHRGREAVAAGTIRVSKEGTGSNMSDVFTKTMAAPKRNGLLDKFTY
jgi:hypothetical protein